MHTTRLRSRSTVSLLLVAALCGVVMTTTGCKSLVKRLFKKGAHSIGVQGGSDEEQALGAYAKGFNLLIDNPVAMLRDYRSEFPESGPAPNKKYKLWDRHTRAAADLVQVEKAFADAAKIDAESMKDLAAPASECVAQMKLVIETYGAMHKYYAAEDYKDDQGKRAVELHGKLIPAAAAFERALATLEEGISRVEDKVADAELAEISDKDSAAYRYRLLVRHANKLVGARQDKLQGAYDQFVATSSSFRDFSKGPKGKPVLQAMATTAEKMEASGKKLLRALADPKPRPDTVSSLRRDLVNQYNGLVSISNAVRDVEAQGAL